MKRARKDKLEAVIEVTGNRIPLSRFKAKQIKTGVSYDLGRGRTRIKGAFIREVFGRVGYGHAIKQEPGKGHIAVLRRKGKTAYPLIELKGPSLAHVFTGTKKILKRAIKLANKKLPENINTQLGLILQRKRKTG